LRIASVGFGGIPKIPYAGQTEIDRLSLLKKNYKTLMRANNEMAIISRHVK
jgi:hypothetical protein